jgi:hypothetical protein
MKKIEELKNPFTYYLATSQNLLQTFGGFALKIEIWQI